MIDEISFVGARILNIIDNKLRFIKYFQFFFGGFNFIMKVDFY
jgi:hypothetical protein